MGMPKGGRLAPCGSCVAYADARGVERDAYGEPLRAPRLVRGRARLAPHGRLDPAAEPVDLCERCTRALVVALRAEGRDVPEGYDWCRDAEAPPRPAPPHPRQLAMF